MSIRIIKLEAPNALHCHYDGQTSSQGCYIELDCEAGTLTASFNGEIGNAIPFSVYHGHDQWFSIPMLTGDAANELMSEIAPLAERVVDGYDCDWDGRNNVATFTDDAQAAIDEIREICDTIEVDELNGVQEYDASEWLNAIMHRCDLDGESCKYGQTVTVKIEDVGTITAKTTDKELIEMEGKIEAGMDANVVLIRLSELLSEERDNCKSNSEE